jgi:hypothetical protein
MLADSELNRTQFTEFRIILITELACQKMRSQKNPGTVLEKRIAVSNL